MRRTGFVLALPLLLPFLAGGPARADDTEPMKPATPATPITPPVAPKPDAPKPDVPKPDAAKPPAPAVDPATPAAPLIPFLTDYEAAKKQAAEEKKGLFVYLTPDWFT